MEVALESGFGGWEGSDVWSASLHIIAWQCACYLSGLFVRPFGWMNSNTDGREGCSGERRQSSGTKVGTCMVCSEGKEQEDRGGVRGWTDIKDTG